MTTGQVIADPMAGDRVAGVDMARCLALLGMMVTHLVFATTRVGDVALAGTWVAQWPVGRASGLFAVLAGLSLALMSGRSTPVRGRERRALGAAVVVRALLVATIGLGLAELDSGLAVILTYYGVLFCLAVPFLGLRAPALAGLALAWAASAPLLSHLLRPRLPDFSYESPSFHDLAEPASLLADLTLTGFYPAVPWLAFVLAGMAVGRLDLRRKRVAVGLILVGTATAVAATLVSGRLLARPGVRQALREGPDQVPRSPERVDALLENTAYGTSPEGSLWWLAAVTPHTATPLDLAQTTGSALAVIGACLLLTRVLPRLWAVVFGAGAMTLSLYSLHVAMRSPLLWPPEDADALLRHVVVILGVGAVFALARRRGPLETMVAIVSSGVRDAVRGSPTSVARR